MSLEGTAKVEYASLSGKIHTIVIDKTLSVSGACADAKATGEAIERMAVEALQQVSTENAYAVVVGGADKKLTDTGIPSVDPSVLFGHKHAMPEWRSLDELTAAMSASKIATGSYVGTGTYGFSVTNSLSNSLTFDFKPKLLVISARDNYGWVTIIPQSHTAIAVVDGIQNNASWCYLSCSLSDNTVTWHGDSADRQLNRQDSGYNYVAFG